MAEKWKLIFSGCELCSPDEVTVKYCSGSLDEAIKEVNERVDNPESMNIEKGCIYDSADVLRYSYTHNGEHKLIEKR